MEQISENANYHAASQHDEIIGNLLKPSWLAEGDLRDNIWVLRMHNPKHVRNSTQRINFDTPIAPNTVLALQKRELVKALERKQEVIDILSRRERELLSLLDKVLPVEKRLKPIAPN